MGDERCDFCNRTYSRERTVDDVDYYRICIGCYEEYQKRVAQVIAKIKKERFNPDAN